MLHRRGMRTGGDRREWIDRLIVAGAGGTDAQASYAAGLLRRRSGLLRPNADDLESVRSMTCWLTQAERTRGMR